MWQCFLNHPLLFSSCDGSCFHAACIAKPKRRNYLKIDKSVWEPVGTSFIEEVDVFNQEAEERDNYLKRKHKIT